MRGSLLILSTHKDKMKTSTIREERNITTKKIMIREERTITIKENSMYNYDQEGSVARSSQESQSLRLQYLFKLK